MPLQQFKIGSLLACFNPETKELRDTAIVADVIYQYSPEAYAKTSYSASPPTVKYILHFAKGDYYKSGEYSESVVNYHRFMLLKQYEEKYGQQIKNRQ